MALGKRRQKQTSFWVETSQLQARGRRPFYSRLNEILGRAEFDTYAERICRKYYATTMGRPSICAGRVLPLLSGGLLRGDRLRARDCLSGMRSARHAPIPVRRWRPPQRPQGFYSNTCQHWLRGDPRAYAVRGTGKPSFKETQLNRGSVQILAQSPK